MSKIANFGKETQGILDVQLGLPNEFWTIKFVKSLSHPNIEVVTAPNFEYQCYWTINV
jgi:hypothetical protein